MKTALVTGANRGIGLHLVKDLLREGWRVIATTRDGKLSTELSHEKERHPETLHVLPLDLLKTADIASLSEKLEPLTKTLDLLISNAGVLLDGNAGLSGLDESKAVNSFRVNSLGPILLFRELRPFLKKSSRPVVAHITSMMGSIEDNKSGSYYSYRMSKAALNMGTKSLSIDHPEMTFVVLHPGWVKTDMGGANAPTSPVESSKGLLKVIDQLQPKDTGKFFDFKGKEIPW